MKKQEIINKLKDWKKAFPEKTTGVITVNKEEHKVNREINKEIDALIKKVDKSKKTKESIDALLRDALKLVKWLRQEREAHRLPVLNKQGEEFNYQFLKQLSEFIDYLIGKFCTANLDRNSSFVTETFVGGDANIDGFVANYKKLKKVLQKQNSSETIAANKFHEEHCKKDEDSTVAILKSIGTDRSEDEKQGEKAEESDDSSDVLGCSNSPPSPSEEDSEILEIEKEFDEILKSNP